MIACGLCGGQEVPIVLAVVGGSAAGVNLLGWLWLRVCVWRKKRR